MACVMSEEGMGSVGPDWSERMQRCESGIEIKRKFSSTVITCTVLQTEYILLFCTNLCITSKLHYLCLIKVDRNIP